MKTVCAPSCWAASVGALLIALFSSPVRGISQVVIFKNGDQLTGEWIKVDSGNLTFKSDALGQAIIPIAKVGTFVVSKPVVVVMKDGQVLSGELALSPSGNWEVKQPGETAVVTVAAALVQAIVPKADYRPQATHQQPWQGWKGRSNLGYSLQRGDQQAGALSMSLNMIRKQPDVPGQPERWRTNYNLTTLFTTSRSQAARISSNSASSSLRQDYLFDPQNFFFVLSQFDHVQSQSLNLRQTYGTGLGRDLLRSPRAALSLLGGGTFVNERFHAAPGRRSGEALVGQKLNLKILKQLSFDNTLNFYPNLSSPGEYRFDSTANLGFRMNSRLSWNIGLTDFYLSRPLSGGRKNNLTVTTGLSFNF